MADIFHWPKEYAWKRYLDLSSSLNIRWFNTLCYQGVVTEVMTDVDQMVMFCLLTKRRINLVRLILDFIIYSVHAKRRRH